MSNSHIFLCGLHRSGTSLLHRCLRDHPLISGFKNIGIPEDEGQHLQSVFPPAYTFGGPGRFGMNPKAHMTEASELCTPANQKRLLAEWGPHWNLSRPYLMEKSPPNLLRTRFLQAMFPKSLFIVIMRHPVPTAYSTQKWTGASLKQLIEHWVVCHEMFEKDKTSLRRYYILRYDDFVRNPDQELDKVYKFLNIESYEIGETIIPDINERYFEKWTKAERSLIKGRQIERIQKQFDARVKMFGYGLYKLDQ